MRLSRDIVIRGRSLGGREAPLVCVPLVGSTREGLLAELAALLPKRPDLVEWRVDHFAPIDNASEVIETLRRLAPAAGSVPLLFTARSPAEGGQRASLSSAQAADLCCRACETGVIGLVDFESSAPSGDVEAVRAAARASGTLLVLSHHDFEATPGEDALFEKFRLAERLGADVAKLAVMPTTTGDALALLAATWRAAQALRIPLFSISMGNIGALTRIVGWLYGSSVTYAVGHAHSAPGQFRIEEVLAAQAILQKAISAQFR
jgi:3-dehydroquinate dehydratase-1